MKKILALTSVLALAACGSSIDTAEMDAHFAGCERIATSAEHLVYKCPSSQEWIAEVKKQEANAKFVTWGEDEALIKEAAQDAKFTLVEVVFGKYGKMDDCAENFHFRTMVKPISEEMWAVTSCKTKAEKPAEEAPAEAPAAK
jgi:hypothetical protein